jgi:putative transposase
MEGYNTSRHTIYKLTYHIIFVTKYRRPVITKEIGDFMVSLARHLCNGYGGELISGESDKDHIHLLISLPPQCELSVIIRSLKTQLSREVHLHPEYDKIVKRYLRGKTPLWAPSYFVATTGSVSLDIVKEYIESQQTEEHQRKYEKRSEYWAGKGNSRSTLRRRHPE